MTATRRVDAERWYYQPPDTLPGGDRPDPTVDEALEVYVDITQRVVEHASGYFHAAIEGRHSGPLIRIFRGDGSLEQHQSIIRHLRLDGPFDDDSGVLEWCGLVDGIPVTYLAMTNQAAA